MGRAKGAGGRRRRAALLVSAVAILGAGAAVSVGATFAAGESCDALNQARENNRNFIAQQEDLAAANPAQAAVFNGRIANREAVIDLIESRLEAAGCNGAADEGEGDEGGAAAPEAAPAQGNQNDNVCQGLSKARDNNRNFIAKQEELAAANPAQAAVFNGRIANREAVIDLIESRLEAAGCT